MGDEYFVKYANVRYPPTRVFQNRMDQNSYRLTISTFHDTKLTIYACTGCGYTERYVLDENALKKIEAKWTPVTK